MSSKETPRRTFLKVVGGVIGGLAVGGATGYLLGSGVTGAPTTGGGAGPSLEPVRLGLAAFLSGPFVTDGQQSVNAAKMAVEEVSGASWFMGGRKVELFTADLAAATPDSVKTAFEQLINVNKVHINVAYWGSYGPGWDLTLQSGIPLITGDTPLGVTDSIAKNPQIRLVDTYSPIGTRRYQKAFLDFFDWLRQSGQWSPRHNPPTMYIVYSDFVWDTNWAEVMKPDAEKRGWSVVGYDLVPSGTPDFSTELAKIRSADPDVIMFANLFPADAGIFVSQFTANPTKSLLCNSFGFAPPESVKVANPNSLVGTVWGSGTLFIRGPKWDAFRAKYIQKFNIEPNIAASHVYDSVYIALHAVNVAGSTDPALIYDSIFNIAYRGLEGTWVFDPDTKIELDYPKLAPNQILQIQKVGNSVDQYISVFPTEVAVTQFQLPSWLK
jgi:branched-chain amino acid transport system substrate-binding protein